MTNRDFRAEMAAIWDKPEGNKVGHMVRARRIVENHIANYGMVPHPDKLKEEIATEIALAELAAVPSRPND